MNDTNITRSLDRVIWGLIALDAAIVFVATILCDFHVLLQSFTVPIGAGIVLIISAWFYRGWRKDHNLASALTCTAQMILVTAAGAPLSYVAASANLPLADTVLANTDSAFAFDWRATLAWMNAHASLHFVLAFAYTSFKLQAITSVLVLAFGGYLVRLRIFTLAVLTSAMVCIAVSMLLPAQGAWGYFHITQIDYPAIVPVTREDHLPIFWGLRDGTLRMLVGASAQGIITFPSFHAALAVIFMVALWPVPVLRWISVSLNGLMILSTPIDGGHYFVDVFAGITVAMACLAAIWTYTFGVLQQKRGITPVQLTADELARREAKPAAEPS